MIQNYLKTGMVFYDDRDKQHFRSKCCKETFFHFTDETHFPSFQVYFDFPVDPLITSHEVKLFDLNDIEIGVFGFPDFIWTLQHGTGDNYWIIHDNRDIIVYPTGFEYGVGYYLTFAIKRSDGFWSTFNSEAFKICECDCGITLIDCNTKRLSFYDTEERGEPGIVLMLIGHAGPQLFYYNKKTYGCWMQRTGAGYSVENMVYAINHSDCNISDSYNVGEGTVSALDDHGFASLIVADDGHIVIAHEKLKDATGNGHNSMMYVKRSDNPEDETLWVNAIAHTAGWYVEVGNDVDPRLAYPNLDKMANGKIFLICRNSTVLDLDHISVHRSDDNGVSWGAMGGPLDGGYEIVDMEYADDGEIMTYKGLCSHPKDNTVYMFFKVWDDDTHVQPDLYFLLSSDNGVTWKSIDGVLSQDITVAGAITKAQLIAGNGRVFNLPGAGSKIYHMSGVITDDGVPYLAVETATTADPDFILYIYYWNGAAWIGVNTTIPVSVTDLSGVTILERGNKIEIIALTQEDTIWKWRIYHALKTDLTTWTIMNEISGEYDGVTSLWSRFTFNHTETDCETFNYMEPTDADWYDFNILTICGESFDCKIKGAGDRINLIENGWFEDWSGVADWNNIPTPWAVEDRDADNYVHDAGGKCQMISDGGAPSLRIEQSILTIGKWYVFTIDITDVIVGSIQIQEGAVNIGTLNTVGTHNIVFEVTSGTEFRIFRSAGGDTDITFTNIRVEEFVGFVFCDKITLNWWSDCDWDDIIYQLGYRNSLVLNTELDNPSEDIVINPEERQGEMFVRDVIIKKRYKFTIRIPEYLWNALIRLPAYGSEMPKFHAWIVLPDGSVAPMSEVAIMGDWDTSNCMNTFAIDFVDDHEYPVVATNCCDNEDYSEI